MSSIGPQLPPHLQQNASNSNDSESDDEGPQPAPAPGSSNSHATAGPQIPVELLQQQQGPVDEEEDDEDDYVPALPPDLAASRAVGPSAPAQSANKKVLGPTFPTRGPYDQDDSDDDVGPMPLPAGYEKHSELDGVKQFLEQEEKRRKNIEDAAKPKALQRDEWMLKPPSSSDLLGTLDPSKLTKARQFSRSAAPAASQNKNDVDLWTETPAERQQRLADEVMGRKRKANAVDAGMSHEEMMEENKRRRRDEEIRRGVEEHTSKIRGSALVDSHSKSFAKKNEDEEDGPKAIWDHGRDMALGGRLMDDSSRNKMIRDAKSLDSRFSTGKSGGFL
ncbi:hypothetical protein AAF712_000133 [Marasmius tenuissimus]|uniref:DUF3752 domain-containing protein n=1 Tax=Marasmius tenuissimus TaxID=585030 RepID=A0ABR3AFY2_9AGAR